jgi:hypothetical protein
VHGVLGYLPKNEDHLEGFILLPRESGELQNFFGTFDWKFQLKNSEEFPHWISKSWRICGGKKFAVAVMSC